jgi:hypothetical protein
MLPRPSHGACEHVTTRMACVGGAPDHAQHATQPHPAPHNTTATATRRCAPQLYKLLHTHLFTRLLLRPVERVVCPMVTVSQLMQLYDIQ